MSRGAETTETWQAEALKALKLSTDRLIFQVYYVRFKECGTAGTVHEYLVKTRGDRAPHRNTVYASMKRIAAVVALYRFAH